MLFLFQPRVQLVIFILMGLDVLGETLPVLPQLHPRLRTAMISSLSDFVNSLQLPQPQAEALQTKLSQDWDFTAFQANNDVAASISAPLACYTLQTALGTAAVDTVPVNKTAVEANWSVVRDGLRTCLDV